MPGTRNLLFALSFLVFLLPLSTISGSIIKTKICKSKQCAVAAKNLKHTIDVTIKPCDDFYRYACGNLPRNRGIGNPISKRCYDNEDEILEYLEQNDDKDEPEAVHKARKLYSMCLSRNSYKGVNLIKQILSKIGLSYRSFWTKENSEFDYVSSIAKAARIAGIKIFFDVSVGANPHNHSVNEILVAKPGQYDYNKIPSMNKLDVAQRRVLMVKKELKEDDSFEEKVIKKMCGVGYPRHCGISNVNIPIDVLLDLDNQRSNIIEKLRSDINSPPIIIVYTLEEFQKMSDSIAEEVQPLLPKLNWTRYIEKTFDGLENVTLDLRNTSEIRIVLQEVDFIQDMIKFIHTRKIKELELIIWWNVVSTLLPYADFDIFREKSGIDTAVTHEEKCSGIVSYPFGMALSYMYMKKDRHNKAKMEIEEMFKNIRENYKKRFQQATWMDAQTREKSLKKLLAMKSLIAYPDTKELSSILKEQYGNVKIRNNFLVTMITIVQDQIKKRLNTLQNRNDPTLANWPLPPTIVNAFYSPLENLMFIPAALLGAPLYYTDNLKALTYGLIGSIVGHEMSHGFDPLGRKFNDKGEFEEWWGNDTLIKYMKKSECFLKAYHSYGIENQESETQVNSTLTLNEDISDNEGFKAALHAYRRYMWENGKEPALVDFDSFTHDQLFTLGFANFWCEDLAFAFSPRSMDTHSPNGVRVNGVLKNSKEFAKIWNCPVGSNMNPAEKCSLW